VAIQCYPCTHPLPAVGAVHCIHCPHLLSCAVPSCCSWCSWVWSCIDSAIRLCACESVWSRLRSGALRGHFQVSGVSQQHHRVACGIPGEGGWVGGGGQGWLGWVVSCVLGLWLGQGVNHGWTGRQGLKGLPAITLTHFWCIVSSTWSALGTLRATSSALAYITDSYMLESSSSQLDLAKAVSSE